MAWQSDEIQPYSSSPADDIFKIQNDLSVIKAILGGGSDAEVAMALANLTDVGNMAGTYTSNTTSLTLTTSNLGKAGVFYGSSAATWTLPAAPAAGSYGKSINIMNRGSAAVTLSRSGTDVMYIDGASATSVVIYPGESIALISEAGCWIVLSFTKNPVQRGVQIGIPSWANAGGSGNPLTSTDILDVYGEISFTPTVVGTTTAGTCSYSAQRGKMVRIGGFIFFTVTVRWSSHTGTGNIKINGFPSGNAFKPYSDSYPVSAVLINSGYAVEAMSTATINPNYPPDVDTFTAIAANGGVLLSGFFPAMYV